MLTTTFLYFVLTVAVCYGQASGTTSKKDDSWIGVWKLDAAKSKFGATPHHDQVLRLTVKGDSLQYDIYTVPASSKVGSISFAVPVDGKEHAIPDGSNVTMTRLSGNTLGVVARRGDKIVQNYKLEVSPDRQTITLVSETDRRVYSRRPDDSFPSEPQSPSK
jgi:hypothetical protein